MNVAVTTLEPAGRDEMVRVALPRVSCAVPSTVFPVVKVTGPAGVTVGDVICAVNVTAWPKMDGFGEDVIVAALVACSTVWFRMGEVLVRLLASPWYLAVSG